MHLLVSSSTPRSAQVNPIQETEQVFGSFGLAQYAEKFLVVKEARKGHCQSEVFTCR
jgi:hypothetical protein